MDDASLTIAAHNRLIAHYTQRHAEYLRAARDAISADEKHKLLRYAATWRAAIAGQNRARAVYA